MEISLKTINYFPNEDNAFLSLQSDTQDLAGPQNNNFVFIYAFTKCFKINSLSFMV